MSLYYPKGIMIILFVLWMVFVVFWILRSWNLFYLREINTVYSEPHFEVILFGLVKFGIPSFWWFPAASTDSTTLRVFFLLKSCYFKVRQIKRSNCLNLKVCVLNTGIIREAGNRAFQMNALELWGLTGLVNPLPGFISDFCFIL